MPDNSSPDIALLLATAAPYLLPGPVVPTLNVEVLLLVAERAGLDSGLVGEPLRTCNLLLETLNGGFAAPADSDQLPVSFASSWLAVQDLVAAAVARAEFDRDTLESAGEDAGRLHVLLQGLREVFALTDWLGPLVEGALGYAVQSGGE